MIEGIVLILKLIFAILSFFLEKDAIVKTRKREALEKILKGIEDEDPSAITAGFDNINRRDA